MEEKDYIASLENMLIYMCQTYQINDDMFFQEWTQHKSDTYLRFHPVKTLPNRKAVKLIGQLPFQVPSGGFGDMYQKMLENRNRLEQHEKEISK